MALLDEFTRIILKGNFSNISDKQTQSFSQRVANLQKKKLIMDNCTGNKFKTFFLQIKIHLEYIYIYIYIRTGKLVIANTLFQQHKRKLYTWTSLDSQHWNHSDYIPCRQRWRSSIQSAKTRQGADCGQVMNSLLLNSDLNWSRETH